MNINRNNRKGHKVLKKLEQDDVTKSVESTPEENEMSKNNKNRIKAYLEKKHKK